MVHELDPKELVDVREMMMAKTIQVDIMYQLLTRRDILLRRNLWKR